MIRLLEKKCLKNCKITRCYHAAKQAFYRNTIYCVICRGHDIVIKLLKMQQLDDEDDELAYR